jgi:hypothetical protein
MEKDHPYPDWVGTLDDTVFRHISFSQRVSPFKTNRFSLGSEYPMPELLDYSFNRHGFRSMEFHENTTMVTLGCSHTLGVGVPEKFIWPTFAKEMLGVDDFVNLGIPGCSIAKQVRTLSTYIRNYGPPKIVLCTFPELTRYEHTKENGDIVDGNTYKGMRENSYTINQAVTQSIIALSALEAMCHAHGILLRWQIWADIEDFHKNKLAEHFRHFVPNKYTVNYLQLNEPKIDSRTSEVYGKYAHDDWDLDCCAELRDRSDGCFNYGYDRYLVPKSMQKHSSTFEKNELEKLKIETLRIEDNRVMAHFGSHAHWHWAKNLVESI